MPGTYGSRHGTPQATVGFGAWSTSALRDSAEAAGPSRWGYRCPQVLRLLLGSQRQSIQHDHIEGMEGKGLRDYGLGINVARAYPTTGTVES